MWKLKAQIELQMREILSRVMKSDDISCHLGVLWREKDRSSFCEWGDVFWTGYLVVYRLPGSKQQWTSSERCYHHYMLISNCKHRTKKHIEHARFVCFTSSECNFHKFCWRGVLEKKGKGIEYWPFGLGPACDKIGELLASSLHSPIYLKESCCTTLAF